MTSADQAPGGSERTRPTAKPYWTDFRGPFRDGHYREQPIRTNWPASGLKPLWKQPIGGGYASFVIARNRAFTIEQRGPQEVVAGYDVRTGRELWTNGWNALFTESLGGDGPRATPTWADGVVYALGATGELRALDEGTGRVLWRTNIIDENGATNLDWGMAASPLVVGETVVVLPGGPEWSFGRGLQPADRKARVVGARRQAGLLVPDAGHAWRRPADHRFCGDAIDGSVSRSGRVVVGLSVADAVRHQRRAAAARRRQPHLLCRPAMARVLRSSS